MTNMESRGLVLSIGAGTMAAMASVCAKLATSTVVENFSKFVLASIATGDTNINIEDKDFENDDFLLNYLNYVPIFIRILLICAVFLCNALMWTLFTKSLQFLSCLHATITNTACNFLVSAILGKVLFGEALPVLWWIGSMFVLVGLLLIHRAEQKDIKQKAS